MGGTGQRGGALLIAVAAVEARLARATMGSKALAMMPQVAALTLPLAITPPLVAAAL